jgi:superfamily II DNA or RNA helicase
LHNIIMPDFVLGMTATPFRTDSMKLCFSKVIKDAGIHQLIQDGYLSRYHHYTIPNWNPNTVAEFYAADPTRWG